MVQKRLHAIYLRGLKKKYREIVEIIGCSEASVGNWIRTFQLHGIDELKKVDMARPQSKLALHRQTIEDFFRKNPPASIREAIVKIKELTGLERSERVVRDFLKSIGMGYRKSGRLPGKANLEKRLSKKKYWSHA